MAPPTEMKQPKTPEQQTDPSKPRSDVYGPERDPGTKSIHQEADGDRGGKLNLHR
jgi:hypothetical protein